MLLQSAVPSATVQGSLLLVYAAVAVVALVVLIARYKLNPFVTLVVVSLALGVSVGMPMGGIVKAFETGVGNTLGQPLCSGEHLLSFAGRSARQKPTRERQRCLRGVSAILPSHESPDGLAELADTGGVTTAPDQRLGGIAPTPMCR